MLGLNPAEITKDKLYRCACRLYDLHHELENWLSNRVRTLFGRENKILLFDLSNTYFEGRMQNSSLAKYGRSKEKRTDCKQVVLAAIVNTNGLPHGGGKKKHCVAALQALAQCMGKYSTWNTHGFAGDSNRVGGTGLFLVPTSHTTVRAVRHTAVP
jgi:hypothetical protein